MNPLRSATSCLNGIARYLKRFPIKAGNSNLDDIYPGNSVELLVNGNEILPAILNSINTAKTSIQFQVMLFHPDSVGKEIAQALMEAARRGVIVQLMFNKHMSVAGSIAWRFSKRKRNQFTEQMNNILGTFERSGISVLDNVPGYPSNVMSLHTETQAWREAAREAICIQANHVDHRKLLIVDYHQAILGGTNVGREYLYHDPIEIELSMAEEASTRKQANEPEAWEKWLDNAILVEGPVVAQLTQEFNMRWEILGGKYSSPPDTKKTVGPCDAIVLSQRPGEEQIAKGYITLLRKARKSVYACSPYISYGIILDELARTASRGVQVNLFFPGDHNDIPFSRKIIRKATQNLMEAGVKVYENNRRMVHSKVLAVDEEWVSIGSSNLNFRSLVHDFELNLLIRNRGFREIVQERIFEPYINQSQLLPAPYKITLNPFEKVALPFS